MNQIKRFKHAEYFEQAKELLAAQYGIIFNRFNMALCPFHKEKVFKNYQRRQEAVDRALRDVFLAGVSTRRVGEACPPYWMSR